ncbi:hypothetical protein TNCV_2005821 [Trichonephila clavipes]|nr:hypothetical protein TNCV_2005821 [Trichonephila clavipes]
MVLGKLLSGAENQDKDENQLKEELDGIIEKIKEADVIKSIKIGSLRTKGRSKSRWADCVEDDFKVLRVTNWKTVAKRRSEWKRVLKNDLTHPGLLRQ